MCHQLRPAHLLFIHLSRFEIWSIWHFMFVLLKNQMERNQVVADNIFKTGFQMAQSTPTTALHKKPISPFQEIFG